MPRILKESVGAEIHRIEYSYDHKTEEGKFHARAFVWIKLLDKDDNPIDRININVDLTEQDDPLTNQERFNTPSSEDRVLIKDAGLAAITEWTTEPV